MAFSIYKITNSVNNRVYIGQTRRSLQERFNEHCRISCKNNKHSILTRAIAKYGKDKFKIELIKQFENITQKYLDKLETYYIARYKALAPNGYNLCKTGSVLDSITIYLTYDKYLITTPEGIQFCTYGLLDVYQKYGVSREAITSLTVPNHRQFGKTHKGWKCEKLFRTEKELEEIKLIQERKELQKQENIRQRVKQASFSVAKTNGTYLLINPEGEEVFCTYGLSHLKESHNLDPSCLAKVVRGKISHHRGWKVILLEKANADKERKKPNVNYDNFNTYEVITPTGEVVVTNKLSIFAKEHNIDPDYLRKVAKGQQKQHKGYKCRLLTET